MCLELDPNILTRFGFEYLVNIRNSMYVIWFDLNNGIVFGLAGPILFGFGLKIWYLIWIWMIMCIGIQIWIYEINHHGFKCEKFVFTQLWLFIAFLLDLTSYNLLCSINLLKLCKITLVFVSRCPSLLKLL